MCVDEEVTETDITPPTAPDPVEILTPEPEPVDTTPVKQPVTTTPASDQRRVNIDTGLMEWKDSKSPKVGAASEWKYELDTVLSYILNG